MCITRCMSWRLARPEAITAITPSGRSSISAVLWGRRREFAHYPEFADLEMQQRIPDPTAEATFAMARLDWSEPCQGTHATWLDRYRRLLAIRRREIVPRLPSIEPGGTYDVL